MTGIVLTGGGAQIKNLKQFVAFVTGKETRIGYPNEHLGSDSKDEVVSPMYATGVGLVLKGFEHEDYIRTSTTTEVEEKAENNIEKDAIGVLDKIKEWFTEENIN